MSIVPQDQATQLRERMLRGNIVPNPATVAPRLSDRLYVPPVKTAVGRKSAHVLAVASGKGGVGKTNIAVNLAITLARRGRRVVLVDADLGTANVDVMMNVQSPYDLSHVLRGERSIDEIALKLEPGLRLIAGASGLSGIADLPPMDRRALVAQLSSFEAQCELMILDCGAGISQNVLAFTHAADEVMIVTTPEPPALTDAYALVKVLCRSQPPPAMSIVVNQVNSLREGQLVASRVTAVAERFLGTPVAAAGQVLRDAHVGLAVRQRVPFVVKYPRSPAADCIAALATRVETLHQRSPAAPGFFDRLLGFFY